VEAVASAAGFTAAEFTLVLAGGLLPGAALLLSFKDPIETPIEF
jgi:hypothetical protein